MMNLIPWIKALHVVAVISWMAGLLYLPRLFVYHSESGLGSDRGEIFLVMERRLLRGIMNSALLITWLTGGLMVWASEFYLDRWFHWKFLLVLILSGFHGWLSLERKNISSNAGIKSSRFYRFANEFPTLLMIGIVVLVVVRPF